MSGRNTIYENSAGLFAGDLHLAGTVTVTPWFQVGLEMYSLLLVSGNGFENNSGFTTINGGGRLRLLFGSFAAQ